VVGATVAEVVEDLAVNGPLLAPGYGEQGATVGDLRRVFAGVTDRVLPSSSRELLREGPSVGALAAAARRTNEALATLHAPVAGPPSLQPPDPVH
jgi:orotidine-5'-phosphate decarboxylase